MRAISGWRFALAIVLPIMLATVSAVGLTYDLLWQVETSSNMAERMRNTLAIERVFDADVKELSRLARDNAQWDEAVEHTSRKVNQEWFRNTWGRSVSAGSAYDYAAVIDLSTGDVLAHNLSGPEEKPALADFTGLPFSELQQRLRRTLADDGILSGHVVSKWGPAAVAIAAVKSPSGSAQDSSRLLLFYRAHSEQRLASMGRQQLLMGLQIQPAGSASKADLELEGLTGANVLNVSWLDKNLGAILTQAAWQKSALVLGFLIMVMAGIAIVCMRLLRQLSDKEEEASFSAAHDHLTGLSNRRALMDTLKQNVGQPHTLVFADLDGFKEVNDSFGHEYGDRLICMVAAGVKQLSLKARLVGRLGGDEFVVLFEGADGVERAREFSDRLIRLLAQPFNMEGRMALVGASIGIAESISGIDENEVLRRADIAMYKAKTDGKNRYCVYNVNFDQERQDSVAIAAELKQILDQRSLEVAFQPVVNARNGAVSGVEALARWPKSSSRTVSADRFIAVAETSGLIDQLGALILDKACAAAKEWPQVRLAVNISAVQLNNPRFVEQSLGIIATHGIAPNRLEFEITETSLIQDADRAKQVFKALQGVGIKVALDDFGTGFSSIGYLRRFQFDRIKIDKSITSKLVTSPSELSVVQGVLLVARGLSLEVTAEGVETDEEAQILRLAGCTELQGHRFYKAMDAASVARALAVTQARPPALTQVVA